MVLPLSIARWSNREKVPSAATFFAVSMFNLSGAINVLLFLIVRPQLLLFSHPDEFKEQEQEEVELGRRSTTGSAIFPNTPEYNQPTGTALMDDTEGGVWHPTLDDNSPLSRIDSRPNSDGI